MRAERGGTERRLKREARSSQGFLLASITLGFLVGLSVIGQGFLLATCIDRAVFRGQTLGDLALPLVGLIGLSLLRFGFSFAAELAGFEASARVRRALRGRLLAHLFALGPVRAGRERSGELAASVIEGIEALDPYIARYLPQLAQVALVPLAILTVVVPLDWESGAVLLVSGPLIPLFMVLVGSRAEAINRRQWRTLRRMGAHFLDVVQGLTTLKLFGRARAEIALVARVSEDYRRTTMGSLRVAFLTSAVLEFFASLSIALVAVLFGTRLLHGEVAFFPALFVLVLVPEFFLPLRTLSVHYHARLSALAAAERIFAILDERACRPRGTLSPPKGPISLSCSGLSVAYVPGRPVLHGICCAIPAGRTTALVGPSGAGKSTLVAALLGFIAPSAGEILVNGTTPLTRIAPERWWRSLAYVPQRPRLFSGTIAENLRIARPDADLPALRRAAADAGALPFIEALPEGFAADIGEGGARLSGGEVQRLALARAFLKDAPLLILDEASAALDPETEAEVLAAIARLVRGRTAVVIAHRLATLELADQVLVFCEGCIVEAGPRRAPARCGGASRAMLGTALGVIDA